MKEILSYLFEHKTLSKDKAKEVLRDVAAGKFNENELAAFLTVYCIRPASIDEFEGFMEVLQELCTRVNLGDVSTIDMCGTGGDGKHTINISTLSSFVVAGAGVKVAKHGNYGVSSGCGSSNVLEALGYRFTSDEASLRSSINHSGICFMHAPLFHPAMKVVGPVRRSLGVKTFFNMLGPLINPAFPAGQVTGVYNREVARFYKYVLQKTNKEFVIIHSLDGYDEISLTAPFLMISRTSERIITPENFGFKTYTHSDIAGASTIPAATTIFMDILEGRGTRAQNDVITANAAVGIQVANPSLGLHECVSRARQSLHDKAALGVLHSLLGNQ
jgi:anthranilate phosphoribosyltransferase